MIIVVGFLVAVLSVPLCGGRLVAVGDIKVHHTHLVVVSFAIQTLVISFVAADVPHWMAEAIHLYSYALSLTFVALNLRIRGLPLLTFGAVLNTIAIVLNGGVMPASASALRTAGLAAANGSFANSDLADDSWFLVFGDIFAIPEGWPFANVFSIGDVVLVIGAGVILHHACGSRLVRGSRPRPPALTVG